MAVLKLLVRVAFICNICFPSGIPDPMAARTRRMVISISTVIVMGYRMGLPVNTIVFGWTTCSRGGGKMAGCGASRLAAVL